MHLILERAVGALSTLSTAMTFEARLAAILEQPKVVIYLDADTIVQVGGCGGQLRRKL